MGNELLVNWRGVEVLGACLWRIVALSSTLREYNTSKILGFEMKNLLLLQVQGGSEITPFLEIFWLFGLPISTCSTYCKWRCVTTNDNQARLRLKSFINVSAWFIS